MSDQDHEQSPAGAPAEAPQPPSEHLNIKVTDGNNEVFFKIKRSTKLEKLMNAFCERQGKQISTVRFLFDGQRVAPGDSPDTVSPLPLRRSSHLPHSRLSLVTPCPLTTNNSNTSWPMPSKTSFSIHADFV